MMVFLSSRNWIWIPTAVEYDSSRLLRHVVGTYAGGTLASALGSQTIIVKEWHGVPLEKRPISITAMRHHLGADAAVATHILVGQLQIYYHIVELSLEELGIINASRR